MLGRHLRLLRRRSRDASCGHQLRRRQAPRAKTMRSAQRLGTFSSSIGRRDLHGLSGFAPAAPASAGRAAPRDRRPVQMTRAEAVTRIVAIIDGAQPPATQVVETASATSSSATDGDVVVFPASALATSAVSRPSQAGGSAESNGERKHARRGDDDNLDLTLARQAPMTDLGNAQRFVARNKDRFLWSAVLGWLYWDGRRWARDGADDRVKMAEHATVRAIAEEARALKGTKWDTVVGHERDGTPVKRSDKLLKWATASQAASKLAPIARHAAPYLAVDPGKLDADPFMIKVNNGTLVVRKPADGANYVTLKPHDPADLISKLATVGYDPDAAAPRFDLFLAEIQRDAETRAFLLRWLGYGLTGDTSEQKLAVFWGKGRNGKSVLIDTAAFIGGDYAETVPIEAFLAEGRGRSAGQATPD